MSLNLRLGFWNNFETEKGAISTCSGSVGSGTDERFVVGCLTQIDGQFDDADSNDLVYRINRRCIYNEQPQTGPGRSNIQGRDSWRPDSLIRIDKKCPCLWIQNKFAWMTVMWLSMPKKLWSAMSLIVMFLENHIENAMTAFTKPILAMLIKDLNRKFSNGPTRPEIPDVVRLTMIFLAVQWMQQVRQKCIFNLIWFVPSSLLNQRNHQAELDFHGESSYDSYHMTHIIWVIFGI